MPLTLLVDFEIIEVDHSLVVRISTIRDTRKYTYVQENVSYIKAIRDTSLTCRYFWRLRLCEVQFVHLAKHLVLLIWLENYLFRRRQKAFFVNKSDSQLGFNEAGYPRARFLGPLLLLSYINDITLIADGTSFQGHISTIPGPS